MLAFFVTLTNNGYANGLFSDTTRAYAVPTLVKTPKGNVAISWTEKDKAGVVYFYWAASADKGQTFGNKKLIFSSAGIRKFAADATKISVQKRRHAGGCFFAPWARNGCGSKHAAQCPCQP